MANAGITVETRHSEGDLHALRTGATAVGMVVALGILAMTVGLIRAETSREVRILSAAGATSRIRRSITAATAGGLALLGALIGTAGAFLAIIAVHARHLGALIQVPGLHLVLIGIASRWPPQLPGGCWQDGSHRRSPGTRSIRHRDAPSAPG